MSGRLYGPELALRRLLPERAKTAWRLARRAQKPASPPAPAIPQAQLDDAVLLSDRREILRRLPQGGRVRRHEMMTTDYLARPEAGIFGWIYVDADHGYEPVLRDIAATKGRVKPGGLPVFNDFARIVHPGFGVFGVHQAMCEFLAAEDWPVAFLCFQKKALYGIALRRPEVTR